MEKQKQYDEKKVIDPKIHRRILGFLNTARSPKDLMLPPQQKVDIEEEHQVISPIRAKRAPRRKPVRGATALIDAQTAKAIFSWRENNEPLTGYTHIKFLFELFERPVAAELTAHLSTHFGRANFGEMAELILENPDGTPVSHSIEHAAVLRSGKVILWGDPLEYVLWTPNPPVATPPETAWAAFPTTYLAAGGVVTNFEPVCSGHSFLTNGKLLVVGGEPQGSVKGAWKFDPIAEIWERTAGDMAVARWYPTASTLGDDSGRVMVASGVFNAVPPLLMEIYSESTDSFLPVAITGVDDKAFPQLYPGLNVLPSGLVFYTPVGFSSCGGIPAGAAVQSAYFSFSDQLTGSWTDIGVNFRYKGMSLLLLRKNVADPDRIMVAGGGIAADMTTSQVIDISTPVPAWGATTVMNHPRRNVNVVQLPNGKVFACGGRNELNAAVLPCELYDPTADSWDLMDTLSHERAYHSVAVLLPSAKVMTTGGGGDCALSFNSSLEIFSPPYLFNPDGTEATRPVITSYPDPAAGQMVHHGATFELGISDPLDVSTIVMVRPMAVTHQTDTEQRVIQLSHMPSGPGTRTVTAPSGSVYPYGGPAGGHSHSIAPKGYYMLFVLNNQGVPSEGKFVFLH